ncbi:hypothetical protein ACJA23_01670 [Mycoplasma corogypsi]|uniref:hypothetical protein n=1 Tax=Mycoplasma corogypsi TaxID=2106 RepID=UPI003873A359
MLRRKLLLLLSSTSLLSTLSLVACVEPNANAHQQTSLSSVSSKNYETANQLALFKGNLEVVSGLKSVYDQYMSGKISEDQFNKMVDKFVEGLKTLPATTEGEKPQTNEVLPVFTADKLVVSTPSEAEVSSEVEANSSTTEEAPKAKTYAAYSLAFAPLSLSVTTDKKYEKTLTPILKYIDNYYKVAFNKMQSDPNLANIYEATFNAYHKEFTDYANVLTKTVQDATNWPKLTRTLYDLFKSFNTALRIFSAVRETQRPPLYLTITTKPNEDGTRMVETWESYPASELDVVDLTNNTLVSDMFDFITNNVKRIGEHIKATGARIKNTRYANVGQRMIDSYVPAFTEWKESVKNKSLAEQIDSVAGAFEYFVSRRNLGFVDLRTNPNYFSESYDSTLSVDWYVPFFDQINKEQVSKWSELNLETYKAKVSEWENQSYASSYLYAKYSDNRRVAKEFLEKVEYNAGLSFEELKAKLNELFSEEKVGVALENEQETKLLASAQSQYAALKTEYDSLVSDLNSKVNNQENVKNNYSALYSSLLKDVEKELKDKTKVLDDNALKSNYEKTKLTYELNKLIVLKTVLTHAKKMLLYVEYWKNAGVSDVLAELRLNSGLQDNEADNSVFLAKQNSDAAQLALSDLDPKLSSLVKVASANKSLFASYRKYKRLTVDNNDQLKSQLLANLELVKELVMPLETMKTSLDEYIQGKKNQTNDVSDELVSKVNDVIAKIESLKTENAENTSEKVKETGTKLNEVFTSINSLTTSVSRKYELKANSQTNLAERQSGWKLLPVQELIWFTQQDYVPTQAKLLSLKDNLNKRGSTAFLSELLNSYSTLVKSGRNDIPLDFLLYNEIDPENSQTSQALKDAWSPILPLIKAYYAANEKLLNAVASKAGKDKLTTLRNELKAVRTKVYTAVQNASYTTKTNDQNQEVKELKAEFSAKGTYSVYQHSGAIAITLYPLNYLKVLTQKQALVEVLEWLETLNLTPAN